MSALLGEAQRLQGFGVLLGHAAADDARRRLRPLQGLLRKVFATRRQPHGSHDLRKDVGDLRVHPQRHLHHLLEDVRLPVPLGLLKLLTLLLYFFILL